mgnify:CR=1 FL=1
MKKNRIRRFVFTACLVLGLVLSPKVQSEVQAAEIIATVHGTILSDTTSEILHLSTKQGKMEIKLDSGTDTSGCKILLPNKEISVSVAGGNDGYLHAVQITSEAPVQNDTLDMSTSAKVTGKISDKTKNNIIYLETPQGEMQIKLDTTTDVSGCSVLVAGNSYDITVARGSDSWMHAVSISDKASSSSSNNTESNTNTSSNPYSTYMSVSGKVNDRTSESILFLTTDEGTMQFKIDSTTDTSNGLMLTPENKLTVYFYNGTDAYLHAAAIFGKKDGSSSASIDTGSTVTVSGTVKSKSTENILCLDTPQGIMELKLDALKNLSGCKVLTAGKRVSVSCGYGSDAYMHALDITGLS